MINCATLKGVTIPEGVVTKIESGGVVLWSAVSFVSLCEFGTCATTPLFGTNVYSGSVSYPDFDFSSANTLNVNGVNYPVVYEQNSSTTHKYAVGGVSHMALTAENPFAAVLSVNTSNKTASISFYSYVAGTYSVSLGYVG